MLPKIRVTHNGLRLMALPAQQTATTLTLGDDNSGSRVVRVMLEPYTSQFAYFQVGGPAVTCGTSSILLSQFESVYVDVRGITNIAVLAVASTAFINVTPLENIGD